MTTIQSHLVVRLLVIEQADLVAIQKRGKRHSSQIKVLPGKNGDRIREIQALLTRSIPGLSPDKLACEYTPDEVVEMFLAAQSVAVPA